MDSSDSDEYGTNGVRPTVPELIITGMADPSMVGSKAVVIRAEKVALVVLALVHGLRPKPLGLGLRHDIIEGGDDSPCVRAIKNRQECDLRT